ncbi:MAG: hypothetical protein FJ088_14785 [Deltaproteobacteria bacterium]|nr:hypothetical protein [Deltaproteobacteria bacterium]
MGKIIISLDDRHEESLREIVEKYHSGKRGGIKKVIESSIDNLLKNIERERAVKRQKMLMKNGAGYRTIGGKAYRKREDIYV